MTSKRFAVVVGGVAFGICLLGVGVFRPIPRARLGGLSITFAGLTNDASGATLAQFNITNAFFHSVRFQVGDVEVLRTNGWPNVILNNSGNGFLRRLAARSHSVFSVAVPTEQGATWRVPLMYQKNRVGVERWWFEDVEKAVYDLRGGHGPQFYRLPWSFTNSPEMVGMPNYRLP